MRRIVQLCRIGDTGSGPTTVRVLPSGIKKNFGGVCHVPEKNKKNEMRTRCANLVPELRKKTKNAAASSNAPEFVAKNCSAPAAGYFI